MKPGAIDRPTFCEFESIFYGELHNICQKWAHYFEIYERHLSRFRGRSIRLLEIGVSQGGSLDLWRRYLGQEAEIIGVDIDPLCKRFEATNTRIVIGDQEDRDFLAALGTELGCIDVIIDDGGHTMTQQKNTLELLFPIISEGGVYICEDCHTSYQPSYGGGLRHQDTFIETTKNHIDDLYSFHPGGPEMRPFSAMIGSLSFYDSVVVIERRSRTAPQPVEVGREMKLSF